MSRYTRLAGWVVSTSLVWALGPSTCPGADITAHRGASGQAPENTLASFRLAWEQGADAIEGDFYLTADGQVVCIHDKTTERTAGTKLVVAESTLAELRELEVGSWKGAEWSGERIPTLAEVLEAVPGHDKKIYIELKCGPEIVGPLKQGLAASRLRPEQVRIISFHRNTLAECRRQIPHLRTCWLSSYKKDAKGVSRPTAEEVVRRLREIGADSFGSSSDRNIVDAEFVQKLRQGGVQDIHVWTVNDLEDAVYFKALGVDGITTDHPARIRSQLSAWQAAAHEPGTVSK